MARVCRQSPRSDSLTSSPSLELMIAATMLRYGRFGASFSKYRRRVVSQSSAPPHEARRRASAYWPRSKQPSTAAAKLPTSSAFFTTWLSVARPAAPAAAPAGAGSAAAAWVALGGSVALESPSASPSPSPDGDEADAPSASSDPKKSSADLVVGASATPALSPAGSVAAAFFSALVASTSCAIFSASKPSLRRSLDRAESSNTSWTKRHTEASCIPGSPPAAVGLASASAALASHRAL
mmetsp:Transcript_36202/g.81355  ORF Transcript_36202/g.81355 Transcript_36202/m.81355 type:complete len:239 (+) Transcript_36202:1291-2007(+)